MQDTGVLSQAQVNRFCRQFLQLERDLDYPEGPVLRQESTQKAIYEQLFSSDGPSYSPPVRYQLRVLKELVQRVESSIEDWDTHGVSEDLMNALAELLASAIPPETFGAQQKSYVTYHLSELTQTATSLEVANPEITLLEARSLISASGTTGLQLIRGKRVLELGAGTGYLAILCAKHLCAAQVIASDGSDDVINNLPESFFLNDLQDSPTITPMDLKWGHALVGTEDQQWNHGMPIDVVFGADITYDQSIIPPLIGTIEELFGMFPQVEVLISATERNETTFNAFQSRCRDAGMELNELSFPIAPEAEQAGPFYSDAVPIRICRIRKS
ncbi:Protein-lysine N-methyltransferase EFM3 like protein [Verticillium longisporum]|uniref:Protein-lysine N-methyltransferase EFM3 like protein n=1 Tax=Verticillium longisporum TaxID=100787 RepID=A0A8I2ZWQ3_VERLO|nr:Protein-lysine N-methyltransferase EFM3 like protein [Verticillium longisporum]